MITFVGASPQIAMDPTGSSPEIIVSTPNARRGDLVIVYTFFLDVSGGSTGGPSVPALSETIYEDYAGLGGGGYYAGFASATMQNVRVTRGAGQGGNAWGATTWILRGVSPEPGWLEEFDYVASGEEGTIEWPSQTPGGPGRLALRTVNGIATSGWPPWPTPLTPNLVLWYSARGSLAAGSLVADALTIAAETPTGEMSATYLGFDDSVLSLAGAAMLLVPAESEPTQPSAPTPSRLRLGCADRYGAWITDATYVNTLKRVDWTDIGWERVLDDISTASATIPDNPGNRRCLTDLGGLVPWEYGLLIERDDEQVWSGPITSVRRAGNGLAVGASDTLARFTKLPVIWGEPANYEAVDSATLFADIINTHSFSSHNHWRLTAPEFNVDASITRELRATQEEVAWSVLQELLNASVDAYLVGNTLYCWDVDKGWVYWNGRRAVVLDGPYNQHHDFVYGSFVEQSFKGPIGWSIAGGDQANYFVAPAADVGEQGFRETYYAEDVPSQSRAGILYMRDPNPLHLPTEITGAERDEIFQRRADSAVALRRLPPAVLDGVPLSNSAPIDVANLRPGSIWMMDVHDFGFPQLLQACRLKRVSVSVSRNQDGGVLEDVMPTLYPIGWEGGAGG